MSNRNHRHNPIEASAGAESPRREILVIEDDFATRRCMMQLIRIWGYEPRAFASAQEVLDGYHEQHRERAVVLDIRLPGMSGLDAGRELRRRGGRRRSSS